MNLLIFSKFARKNLRTNRVLIAPFVLSSSFMFMLFYVVNSLVTNEYVISRHSALVKIIYFGEILLVIFAVIFVLYCNNILDRQRSKEFALYSILGLEKKHIALIVFIEKVIMFLVTVVLSVFGGYVFGKLTFLALSKLLGDRITSLSTNYPFEISHAFYTSALIACIYIVLYIINITRITTITPIALLSYGKKNEKEPKTKIIILLLGIATLGAGYGIALTVNGALKSLLYFFIATILVIIGTYFLFMAFSIFILKLLRKNKKFYYKDKHFLSISGMLYRMKSNAVGLATICIFSTSIILSLGTTASIYNGIESMFNSTYPKEYNLDVQLKDGISSAEVKKTQKEYIERIQKVMPSANARELHSFVSAMSAINIKGNVLNKPKESDINSFEIPTIVIFSDLESYNNYNKTDLKLKDGQIGIHDPHSNLKKSDKVQLLGKNYEKVYLEKGTSSPIPKSMLVVVPTLEHLQKINTVVNNDETGGFAGRLSIKYSWDNNGNSKVDAKKIEDEFNSDDQANFLMKSKEIPHIYELNGGFLLIGLIISIIFITGNILITYYKRISEAYDDRERYQIMKKLGLEDKLIKKTSRKQILWIFFMPLVVACIHCLVASRILSQLLVLFGVNNYGVFIYYMGIVLVAFVILYLIVFTVTSKLVYRVVK